MDEWKKKTEELKKMREQRPGAASSASTPSTTSSPSPSPRPPTQTPPASPNSRPPTTSSPRPPTTTSQPSPLSSTSSPRPSIVTTPPPNSRPPTSTPQPSSGLSPVVRVASTPTIATAGAPRLGATRPLDNSSSRTAATGTAANAEPPQRSPPSSPSPGSSREVELLRNELREIKHKYEVEVKRRTELEKRLREKMLASTPAARPGEVVPPLTAEQKQRILDKRRTKRMTKRQTRMVNAKQSGDSILGHITMVLNEMGRLEGQIKEAEEQRILAEDKLMELAVENTQLRKALQAAGIDIPGVTSLNTSTRGTMDRSSSTSTPPPPPPMMNSAGNVMARPPPPPGMGAPMQRTASSTGLSSASSSGGLLDQIQKGISLSKIDMEKMKRERAEKSSARQSVSLLKSLEDTLRQALNQRTEALMGADDEDDDEDFLDDDDDWI